MARVDGLSTAAIPVEIAAVDSLGTPVTSSGTFAPALVAAITRASDGYTYDWSDATFKASPSQGTRALVEVDATSWPGLWHVAAGFTPAADDTYTLTITRTGGLSVANVPLANTLFVGELVGTSVLGTNLVDDLVPMIDELRGDLYADMGVRQYRIYQVRRIWSGGAVGVGACRVAYVRELVPSPLLELDDSHSLTEGGLQATGTATLSEVSLAYTQDQLLGEPLSYGEEFHYLAVDAHGQGLSRRVFIPQDHPVPHRADDTDAAGWRVKVRLVDTPPNVVA